MPMSDFWGKKDYISMARSVRLAVIQNVFSQGQITEEQARELLTGPLTHGDETTAFDDSDCLRVDEVNNEL